MSIRRGWSFDESTPSSGWTTFSATVVSNGRNGNGAQTGFLQSTAPTYGGTEAFAGLAVYPVNNNFTNDIVVIGSVNDLLVELFFVSDGRVQIRANTFLGSPITSDPIDVGISNNEWHFIEIFGTNLVITYNDHGDGTTDVRIQFDFGMFCDGKLNYTNLYDKTTLNVPNANIPVPLIWQLLTIGGPRIVDDVYTSDAYQGDCIIDQFDNFHTPPPPTVARLTQQLIEFAEFNTTAARITQMLLEVALAPGSVNLIGRPGRTIIGYHGGQKVNVAI